MGFIEDKNNIVQQINLQEVLGDLPNNKLISNIASVKSTSFNLYLPINATQGIFFSKPRALKINFCLFALSR